MAGGRRFWGSWRGAPAPIPARAYISLMDLPSPSPQTQPADAARRAFIEGWAEMAVAWGVPRSMAEVHALLFVEARPLSADELMSSLGISRGNASMTVRTLVEWGIVWRSVQAGSRREQYEAEQDVMCLFATVIRVRKQREIDPLLTLVRDCRAKASMGAPDGGFLRKLDDIELFVSAADRLCADLLGERPQALRDFVERSGGAP